MELDLCERALVEWQRRVAHLDASPALDAELYALEGELAAVRARGGSGERVMRHFERLRALDDYLTGGELSSSHLTTVSPRGW
jgi:hypothetical protein